MAPFRLGHDELRHELPWRLMGKGVRREYLDEDVAELDGRHGCSRDR